MAVSYQRAEVIARGTSMLRTAFGPAIARFLHDPDIVEIMLNPDGRIWIDRLKEGLSDTGEQLLPADGERIIRLVAHHVGAEAHAGSPFVSAELPETGERFEGALPPIVTAPAFAIRKPAVAVFGLADYVAAGIMTADQAAILREAVALRANIIVAGGTSTGKTTLVNALLSEVAKSPDRLLILEDMRELQSTSENKVPMRTWEGLAYLSELARRTMRWRPDRIIVGEVRGPEALELLKLWGTGHPGGIGTVHAGSGLGALRRLEQLIQEAVVAVPKALIADSIDFIVVLQGRGSAPVNERTLTGLTVLLQSNPLKQGLQPYCVGGPHGRLLDAESEHLGGAPVQVYETEGLLETPAAAPVLSYLFHRITDRLDGRPTLIVVDEGWLALSDPGFAKQLTEWLVTLRKKNASVIFATQSLAQIEKSKIAAEIVDSCHTRILLPNDRAIEPQITNIYRRFGLNDRQIELIARALPKRDYYCQSREGSRLFELGLSQVGLALAAASSRSDQSLIARIHAEHGHEGFLDAWLRARGVDWAADLIPALTNLEIPS